MLGVLKLGGPVRAGTAMSKSAGGGDAVAAAYMRKQLLEERRLAALNDEPKNEMGESLDAMQVWTVFGLTLLAS